jgi:hypothetical protein
MKNVFLTLVSILLISVSGNCQWYKRQYGVNDIFQLTPGQYKEALMKAKIGERRGIITSTAGVIGIVGGIIEFQVTKNVGEGFGVLFGVGLLAVSIPLEITGLTIWSTYGSRVKTIEEILKNAEIEVGFAEYQTENISSGSPGVLLPCLSVTIRF